MRHDIPLSTTLSAAQAAVDGIEALRKEVLTVRSLQEIYAAQKTHGRRRACARDYDSRIIAKIRYNIIIPEIGHVIFPAVC